MPRKAKSSPRQPSLPNTDAYRHKEAELLLRPEVGTQANFRKKKQPATFRYDSSLAPALDWDDQPARALGEWLLACIEEAAALAPPQRFPEPREYLGAGGQVLCRVEGLAEAVAQLKALSRPFLDWAGKAERLSFTVPTLPLFVHERLSTEAIVQTLKGHKRDRQISMMDLFGDPQHSVSDQILRAYEHRDKWANRLVLGDSLSVMNSLIHYESLGGQVQMIYMDPPYGVKFGSNFQPFVRKRDVKHNDDEDLTREPEMVKAYRDTWELGLHSYLAYLRDRLLLCRELLHPKGSIFVQSSEENLHHIREIMGETFGEDNEVATICYKKPGQRSSKHLSIMTDFILWYAKDKTLIKYNQLYKEKSLSGEGGDHYTQVELGTGEIRPLSMNERINPNSLPAGARVIQSTSLTSGGSQVGDGKFEFNREIYYPPPHKHWSASWPEGMERLRKANRIVAAGKTIRYKRFFDDFPFMEIDNLWDDVGLYGESLYVVTTSTRVVERCILMTTDPGDLVLDPTCGSGTTAYVAEQWGRRWITCDVSRVPLALARQRLLTATYPYYHLQDDKRGPVSGFVYQRKQNNKGEEVGGIVPHITLKSIANDEPPAEEVLVDRPEVDNKLVRVTGPFVFEATIPTPVDWEGDGAEDSGATTGHGSYVERMLEVLRLSPVLHLGGGVSVTLQGVRAPAKTLCLSGEAWVDASAPGQKPTLMDVAQEAAEKDGKYLALSKKTVAIVFGPENGAVSEKLVYEAAREAHAKSYTHLYAIGFAIQPNARQLVESCEEAVGIPATYVAATPDLLMGDLLKNMRSSQIFSVCGLPEIKVHPLKPAKKDDPPLYQVELLGLDVFDPATMENDPRAGNDVPAWFLDTDYNGLCFHVCQAFFPRTAAWDSLKKALKATYDEHVWDHLAGTKSAPFEPGEHRQVAVKVIDDRGNELVVVNTLKSD